MRPALVIRDATDPPFRDGRFDVVVESLMFHHLTDNDKRRCIARIARILRPGGLFYFVDWVKPQSAWSKLSFNIVKLLDGNANVKAHADNTVIAVGIVRALHIDHITKRKDGTGYI